MSTEVTTPTAAACLDGAAADARWWDLWLALHAHVERCVAEALHRHGLGRSEYRALEFLANAPDGRMRMQDLAESLGLNQSSVTRLVERLHRAGFAETTLCSDDGRGVYTVITPAGQDRYRQAQPVYRTTLTTALDDAVTVAPDAASALAVLRRRSVDQ